ncbi:MAG: DUF4065 domain-containing protein [Ekhidna sp.]|nr:DUF4065 domain-containing protein [Ekhidna sp.]MBC6410344.1 DUF4065 domain-containing protein [Ekhidna sp.]
MPSFYSAVQIADYLVEESIRKETSFTLFHVLKLVYIAHGVHLAAVDNSKGLFTEQVEAWKYGPVVPSVYYAFRHNGAKRITKVEAKGGSEHIDKNSQRVLDAVFDKYHLYTGPRLVALTHKESTPWHRVWHEENGAGQLHAIIPNDYIKEYYQEMLSQKA